MTSFPGELPAELLNEVVNSIVPPVGAGEASPQQLWEHDIWISRDTSKEVTLDMLQDMGTRGWELVALRPIELQYQNEVWYYFKKPLMGEMNNAPREQTKELP